MKTLKAIFAIIALVYFAMGMVSCSPATPKESFNVRQSKIQIHLDSMDFNLRMEVLSRPVSK